MKHRSVIAFVLVVAALFSLPQLSHDLRALKGAVGAHLHRELLHAFLNLPAGDPVATPPAARPAETMLASCTQGKSGSKGRKGAAGGRVEGRAAGKGFERGAMIGDPAQDPLNQVASVEIREAADEAVASPDEVMVEAEVAMIIPPENGIDPRGVARALAPNDAARAEADELRVEAEGLRAAYLTAARLQAGDPEWQRSVEAAPRKYDGPLPGAYQFRVVRDGAKAKVLKLKCAECPSTLPRAPRRAPAVAPLPAPSAPVVWVGE